MTKASNFHKYHIFPQQGIFQLTSHKNIKHLDEFIDNINNNSAIKHYLVGEQIHSDKISMIKSIDTDQSHLKEIKESDGLITNLKNTGLIVKTADCVPLLLYDPQKQVIGTIHAGRKGTESEIALKAINLFISEYSSEPKDILAVIGPSICPKCYQIDQEKDLYYDLWQNNKEQLLKAGLEETHIEMSGLCTSCNANDRFWSYRKDQTDDCRTFSVISLK